MNWFGNNNEVPIVERPKEIRASGHCIICRERYTDVPVIDGISACPRCYKMED